MDDALDEGLVDFLYKWNRTESPLGFSVVDLDILQEGGTHPGSFADRKAVLAAVSELMNAVDGTTDDYIASKIRATHTFVRALEGEPMSFDEYIEGTLGVTPRMIEDARLESQRNTNEQLLENMGHPHTRDGVTSWIQANRLDGETVQEQFAQADRNLVPQIKQAAGLDFDITYRTDVVDEDAYWINWTSTDDRGEILVRFNTNDRHIWFAGRPDFLAIHEVAGHAVQTMSWKRHLQQGDLPKSAGVLAVFTPDMFLMEGLADTLPWFCPDLPLSVEARWAINSARLGQMAWNNAHIMANQGATEAEVLQYMEHWAPGYSTDAARTAEYDECLNHPLLRGYLHSYGVGGLRNQEIADRATPEGRRAYLARAYRGPISPSEIVAWSDNPEQDFSRSS